MRPVGAWVGPGDPGIVLGNPSWFSSMPNEAPLAVSSIGSGASCLHCGVGPQCLPSLWAERPSRQDLVGPEDGGGLSPKGRGRHGASGPHELGRNPEREQDDVFPGTQGAGGGRGGSHKGSVWDASPRGSRQLRGEWHWGDHCPDFSGLPSFSADNPIRQVLRDSQTRPWELSLQASINGNGRRAGLEVRVQDRALGRDEGPKHTTNRLCLPVRDDPGPGGGLPEGRG